ncbi:MAG: hypothetical protein Q9160_003136 [Pyrenula sp. 1 TL-2023]
MTNGYPRFFVHLTIRKLEREVLHRYGAENDATILFPSKRIANRCQKFFVEQCSTLTPADVHVLHLVPASAKSSADPGESLETKVSSSLSCVIYPSEYAGIAKQFWQHSGDGISSRRAEFLLKELQEGRLLEVGVPAMSVPQAPRSGRGPRRYQRGGLPTNSSFDGKPTAPTATVTSETNGVSADVLEDDAPLSDLKESTQYIEERFGRNLNVQLAEKAKLAIKRRIAGTLTVDTKDLDSALTAPAETSSARMSGLKENDIYLFPCGMSAIFNTHRLLLSSSSPPKKSVCFGFPYIDTLKILEKWGPGCLFLGNGDDTDCDTLASHLSSKTAEGEGDGESYQALFTEFPSNPLLRSPPLARLKHLCATHSVPLIIDETIGNYLNLSLLPHAAVLVSSLTKIFSGDSNVMGGCAILNPHSPHYPRLKAAFDNDNGGHEDTYWPLDALFMERNSRDFASRIARINDSALALAQLLARSPLVKQVYYPPLLPSRPYYDEYRATDVQSETGGGEQSGGGYGGLLSLTFRNPSHSSIFFDALNVAKGPSLGTNFTLACPYTMLAHYGELEWAQGYGVESGLVRLSVGLEGRETLEAWVREALGAVEESKRDGQGGQ